jgi:hypothetical protein
MDQESFERGKCEAASDIAAHKLRFFWAGRGRWGEFLCELMMSRFGAEVEHLNCFTSEEKQSYETGFNETIIAHIDASYGEGSFKRTLDQVWKYRDELYRRTDSSGDST